MELSRERTFIIAPQDRYTYINHPSKECNDALQLKVDNLSEKVETQENQINKLRMDNFNLKFQVQELKELFEKLIKKIYQKFLKLLTYTHTYILLLLLLI